MESPYRTLQEYAEDPASEDPASEVDRIQTDTESEGEGTYISDGESDLDEGPLMRTLAQNLFKPAPGKTVVEKVNKIFNTVRKVDPAICAEAEEIMRPFIIQKIREHGPIRTADIEEPTRNISLRPFFDIWTNLYIHHADHIKQMPVEAEIEQITNVEIDYFIRRVLMIPVIKEWVEMSSGQTINLTNNWPPTAY